jgi:threonine synthase
VAVVQHRFLETGRMTQRDVKPTIAPAMDIQISSNFERYLHHLCDEDAPSVAQLMDDSRRTGDMAVAKPLHDRARNDFASFAADEDTVCSMQGARSADGAGAGSGQLRADALHIAQIVGAIKKYHAEHDYVLCPHTACGVAAAEHYLANQGADETLPVVCLATAHPAKFNDAVRDAIGKEPEYPPALEAIQSVCAAAIIVALSNDYCAGRLTHRVSHDCHSFLRDVCTRRMTWMPSRT